jgi:acetylornithine deacetylase/succinyl-diaminopimelate desuccinylase-like protein
MRNRTAVMGVLCLLLSVVAAQPLLNHQRMTERFIQLVQIESGSQNEAEICAFVAEQLRQLGAESVLIDDASKQLGGTGRECVCPL